MTRPQFPILTGLQRTWLSTFTGLVLVTQSRMYVHSAVVVEEHHFSSRRPEKGKPP